MLEDLFDVFEELLTDDEDDLINFVEAPRRDRQFRDRPDHLNLWNDEEFVTRFRISKRSVENLRQQIGHFLERRTNQ